MKINTTFVLTTYTGANYKIDDRNDSKPATIGLIVADCLSLSNNSEQPMKLSILARDFYCKNEINLDSADLELVKSEIKKSQRYPAGVKGVVLEYFETLKEEK